MDEFLGIFQQYDFAVREGLILALVALAAYVLLNAGIFAVPQIGLMAIGAYTAASFSLDLGMPFMVSAGAGAVAAALAGWVLALLVGRLNGIYLAIATIAFSEVVRALILVLPFTGGAQGRVAISRSTTDIVLVGAVVVVVALLIRLRKSRHGLAMIAMREDSLMASHQGVNIVRYRRALFALSGLLAGLGGALMVHMTGFVEPTQYSFDTLTLLLSFVVLGGMTYVFGPLVGAAVLLAIPHVFSGLEDYQLIVNGLLIILIIAFAPTGILGWISGAVAKLRARNQTDGKSVDELADLDSPLEDDPGKQAEHTEGSAMSEATDSGIVAVTDSVDEEILSLKDVSISFGGNKILSEVPVLARSGRILGIIGPNGSGKTTLLNVLSGVYHPDTGHGQLLGNRIEEHWGKPHHMSAMGLARTFQTIRLLDDRSVAENVAVGLVSAEPTGGQSRTAQVDQVLKTHGLSDVSLLHAGWLPYGLRRRVEIARAVVSGPRVLLLDEPTAGMNPTEREEVFDMIRALRSAGLAIIVVEHDVDMMRKTCDRLMVLDHGRVLAEGDPDDVLKEEEVIAAYVGGKTQA
jgi:branched-chain amino acid transport system permease protein